MNESNNNQESSSTNTNETEVLVDNLPDFIKELKEIVDEVDKKEYAIFLEDIVIKSTSWFLVY